MARNSQRMVKIPISFGHAQAEELKLVAGETGLTTAEIIRRSLDKYLQDYRMTQVVTAHAKALGE